MHREKASEGGSEVPVDQEGIKHHFTAFVVNGSGQLIELDGCKQGPLVIAEQCEDVLRGAVAEIQKRLADGDISDKVSMITLNAAQ